jgi:hypothetical protein
MRTSRVKAFILDVGMAKNWYLLNPVQAQTPKFSGEVNAFGLFTGGEYNTFASRIILSGYMDLLS